nr:hypothetical protein [uncultured Rhodoferax sp.]
MSAFSSWSYLVRDYLTSLGYRASLGQAQQILAAGLGHNSLASFNNHDKAVLPHARQVVIDAALMAPRARELGFPLDGEQSQDILTSLIRTIDIQAPLVTTGTYVLEACRVVEDCSVRKGVQEILDKLSGTVHNLKAWNAKALEPLAANPRIWMWEVVGFLYVSQEDEILEVPIATEVIFPRLGIHLLGEGRTTRFRQTGDATPYYEEDYPTEFDHNSYD